MGKKQLETLYLETIAFKDKKLDVFECACENIIAVQRRGYTDVDIYCNFCEQTSHVDVSHTYKDKK